MTRDYKNTVFLPRTDFPMRGNLPAREPSRIAQWNDMNLYAKLREARRGRERFVLHDGQPYANGSIHLGHLVEYIQTDVWVRFQKMRGHDCIYCCADDTHGTAIMLRAEKEGIAPETLIDRVWAEHKRDFDGFLVEFASAVDAVRCAVAIQSGMHRREEDLRDDRRLMLRIGPLLTALSVVPAWLLADGRVWVVIPTEILLGLGMAHGQHLQSLRDLNDRVEIAAAFTPSVERRGKFARANPDIDVSRDLDGILADTSIDMIFRLDRTFKRPIATPHRLFKYETTCGSLPSAMASRASGVMPSSPSVVPVITSFD